MAHVIAAVGMCRDEEDIIVPVLCQLLAQGVDRIWVADNLSADKTRPLLEDLAVTHPITIVDDDEPGYYQSLKTSRLAAVAYEAGAEWVLPFDADEWFYGIDGTIAEALSTTDADVVKIYGYDHLPTRRDPDDPNPIRRMGWRRPCTQNWPKVAFRAARDAYIHQGNHDVERGGPRVSGLLEYRHFQYRTLEQMMHKVRVGKAAYEASTVHEMHGTHWRTLGALTDDELATEWNRLLDEDGLVYDPAPMW